MTRIISLFAFNNTSFYKNLVFIVNMTKELTKTEVRDIIKNEISKFISKELDNEVSTLLSKMNSKTRNADNENSKKAIEKLAEFLYIRRNVWKNDIK